MAFLTSTDWPGTGPRAAAESWARLGLLGQPTEHLDQLYPQLLDAGYSPATVLRDHRILSRALTVAMQRGHIARNVATLVDPPRQEPSGIATALDVDEARAVVAAARGTCNAARWTVALALGLRRSEALTLQ